jgi:hypothetical protein
VPNPESALAASIIDVEARTLYKRLGHLSTGSLKGLDAVITGLQGPVKPLKEPCKPCILAKVVRVMNREGPERVIAPLTRLHTDFWSPYSVPSLYGILYFITFINEVTCKTWVFFNKDKALIRTIFIELRARVELETGLKIQAIRCDNALENKALTEYFRPFGLTSLWRRSVRSGHISGHPTPNLIKLHLTMATTPPVDFDVKWHTTYGIILMPHPFTSPDMNSIKKC